LFVGSAVGTITNGILGKYLTDTKGMTLYTFAGDGILKSNCVGDCLKKWPPFVYDNVDFKSALDFPSQRMNVMKRSDGTFQYAYGVQPVYYYYGDVQLGDTNGKGLDGGKWNLVLVQ
jgi:predicted lipoprotein with Yx(FWY)xxD motif